ncbi:MAG: response regulator transcription factor [Lachnospiraceae bacterium]|nr:response regulator transcription factor [Lachnospiraceae bacterium]
MSKILVVDDEKSIVKGLSFSLAQDGYDVVCAYDGEEALEMLHSENPDAVLLDVMLPRLSGFDVLRQMRQFSNVPVIMLTAKGDDIDKLTGLDYGADDYILKPFNILEVKARIKAVLRRTGQKSAAPAAGTRLISGDLIMDTDNRTLSIAGREINLTGKEFELLELMVRHPGKVYDRESLLKRIWGEDYPAEDRTVDVHVRRLREKIESNPSEPRYVRTKWGVGYYYRDPAR